MLSLGTQPPCCEGAQAAHVASPHEEARVETETPTSQQQASIAPPAYSSLDQTSLQMIPAPTFESDS